LPAAINDWSVALAPLSNTGSAQTMRPFDFAPRS
jgi:hypothetical protein